jgi:hypothetical protein
VELLELCMKLVNNLLLLSNNLLSLFNLIQLSLKLSLMFDSHLLNNFLVLSDGQLNTGNVLFLKLLLYSVDELSLAIFLELV